MARDTHTRHLALLPHACWGSLTLHSTAPASLEIVEWVKTDVSLMFFFLIERETLGTLCWKEKGMSCILGVCVSADTRYMQDVVNSYCSLMLFYQHLSPHTLGYNSLVLLPFHNFYHGLSLI
jgi:hypothetical protein